MTTFAQGDEIEQTVFGDVYALDPQGVLSPENGVPFVQPYPVTFFGDENAGTLTRTNASSEAYGGSTFAQGDAIEFYANQSGYDFFEAFHVVPRFFDFGNLLSDQSVPLEVFNAFRRPPPREWTSFTNNAGAGVTLGGLPLLPTDIDNLSSVFLTLEVSTFGDPFVDGTLEFFFLGFGTIIVPIEIQRIVLFGLEPELPFAETLEFVTDVQESKDGSELRVSLRHFPRQSWSYDYIIAEGTEAQILENLLFDFQQRLFGVPVWFEDTVLTAGVSAGATSISVRATAFRDFREGGLAVIFTSQQTFDVLEISPGGITATTLTFESPTVNAYSAGTPVFPLATCLASEHISGSRYPVGLRRKSIDFTNVENVVELADLSPFSTYKGKLLLDNGNSALSGTVTTGTRSRFLTIDGEVGLVFQESPWDRTKPSQIFTLRAEGRQAVWELRRLVHALRGRQISFYVPTDASDLVPVSNLLNASNLLTVTNVGYAQFVRNRQPKSDIRVNFVDGSAPLLRAVTASVVVSPTQETLTVDSNWPATITPAQISRIDYLEKVRFDTDRVTIRYDPSGIRAYLEVPIVGVFE